MFKKFLSLFVIACLLVSGLSISVSAATEDEMTYYQEVGYFETSDIALFAEYATAKYPTWSTMKKMVAGARDIDQILSGNVYYNPDNFVIMIGKTGTYTEPEDYVDTAIIWLYLYDSTGTKLQCSDSRFYISDVSNDVSQDGSLFYYSWNYETNTWDYGGVSTSSFNIREDGYIYTENDLPNYSSTYSVYMPAGVSTTYNNHLQNDDSLGYDGTGIDEPDADPDDNSGFFASILQWFKDVWQAIKDLGTSIGEFFTKLGDRIGTFFTDLFTKLGNWFSDVGTAISTLGTNILNGIKEVFVPDAEYISGKMEALYNKFGFLQVISGIWESFGEMMNEAAEPPSVVVDLGAAEGRWNLGNQKVSLINLSWYARYKPTVDIFFSIFLWLGFGWLLYKRMPDIVSGAGMVSKGALEYSHTQRISRDGD